MIGYTIAYSSNRFESYCNKSDTCNLYCDSYSVCSFTSIYCMGQCNVECENDYSDVYPTIIDYTDDLNKKDNIWQSLLKTISNVAKPDKPESQEFIKMLNCEMPSLTKIIVKY